MFCKNLDMEDTPTVAKEQVDCLKAFLEMSDPGAVRNWVGKARQANHGIFWSFKHQARGQMIRQQAASFAQSKITSIMAYLQLTNSQREAIEFRKAVLG